MKLSKHFIVILTIFITSNMLLEAQVHDMSWRRIIQNDEADWFASQEAKNIAENVLLYQRNIGGWPKNIQMQKPLSKQEKLQLEKLKSSTEDVTTDNNATTQEMLFLSKMYKATADETYKTAFLSGLDYILKAQYPNGGWPQYYPLRKGYYTHITYNDNSMVNILNLLKNLKENTGKYAITPSNETLKKIETAFNKGIDCILKTQYKQNGVLTAWCAQHDAATLEPAKARAYELPSLSGSESAGIVLLLMDIDNPSEAIKTAVNSAVTWFEKVKILGIKQEWVLDAQSKSRNKIIVEDANAEPLWARFMELDDNTPFFCDRDGVKKATIDEIGPERRNGYSWYTENPSKVLKKYPKWKAKYDTSVKKSNTPKNEYNMVVAKDGSGDFTTIQEAMYAAKSFPYQRVIINIKNGVYNEKVHVYSWNTYVSLIGESKENTIITFDDYFGKINLGRNSTFHTSTVLVEGDDFIAKNLTIKNTSGPVGQAVALSVNANRCYFENCTLLGFQDTLYTAGEGFKHYFKDCYIEGTVDFIFGEATVLFDSCTIHSKSNSYITAASTPKGEKFGYVFKNCNLTADANVSEVYLGRPWRLYAKTVFINCNMGNHIRPEGWNNWSKKEAERLTLYAEYNCTGEGFQPEKRVNWSHQLKKSEAKKYTKENILKSNTNNSNSKWYQNL
ncbi:Pectinesterase A precursor [Mariniflexile rhizosphaerae]|uniref:pectate lyase n=1 Tax=unclassified Mariniflexile TaxID=2643887 RepID=UPI000E32F563|nr:pectate lyase [Mariniflexile sp. TRM1-10]AXP80106.1 Pectinesterase A precursor [Mariniflexile sp. TRM1-10]